jgi:hypothetical protein
LVVLEYEEPPGQLLEVAAPGLAEEPGNALGS